MNITIYHGSEEIIVPKYGEGKKNNDYGSGFYCTANIELAKEWACAHGKDGYANSYELETEGLSVLDLNCGDFHILNWLAILLDNRVFPANGPIAKTAREYLLTNFLPEYTNYDIIKGYRADDSYFSFAGDFVGNSLSLKDLSEAMRLGELGEQIVLKSEEAFTLIKLVESFPAPSDEYFAKHTSRDIEARTRYKEIAKHPFSPDDIYVLDLIRGEIKDGDPRLR